MRHSSRMLLAALAATLLASAPRQARADGTDAYLCIKKANDWAKEAKEDANWYEKMAIDTVASLMMVACVGELAK
ncbi:MAG: hypothetical protein KF689_08075 [Gemmatimonadaceae bacterium]|nr:hypothetical protein [Gemmatimonadaceae bacterium]MCW5827443.1 hypothetical protein [Gemmatimonadaceae bacterium]